MLDWYISFSNLHFSPCNLTLKFIQISFKQTSMQHPILGIAIITPTPYPSGTYSKTPPDAWNLTWYQTMYSSALLISIYTYVENLVYKLGTVRYDKKTEQWTRTILTNPLSEKLLKTYRCFLSGTFHVAYPDLGWARVIKTMASESREKESHCVCFCFITMANRAAFNIFGHASGVRFLNLSVIDISDGIMLN